MNNQYHTKNGRTSKRGAFINGIWHCDCEPRMPAEKFQTKNGGKNHGRWFYTCQKSQPKRCGFFLWQDDAQVREQAAVLGNSKSEPNIETPQTPQRSRVLPEPLTPFSRVKPNDNPNPYSKRTEDDSQGTLDHERDDFGWGSSDDEELIAITENSARKALKTDHTQTPKHQLDKDIFQIPSTSKHSHSGLMSPLGTAQSDRIQSATSTGTGTGTGIGTSSSNNIITEVLELLKPANISHAVEEQLVELLSRYELRTQGIIKGRDITRLAVQTKEKKIAELQARISSLEADKETSRTVIAHLKQDIATSPKRPRRPPPAASRYEV